MNTQQSTTDPAAPSGNRHPDGRATDRATLPGATARAATLPGTTDRAATLPGSAAVPGPFDLLRAELGRLLNLRATWGYALTYMLFLVGPPLVMWLSTRNGPPESRFEPTLSGVLIGTDLLTLIAIAFAAAGSAGDIAGRRVAFGYLASGSRWGIHAARLIAQLILIAAATLSGFAVTAGILAAGGVLSVENPGGAALTFGLILVWAAVGSGVGMLVPVPAVAVAVPLGWILVFEMAVSLIPLEWAETLSGYLPWTAARQLLGMMDIGVSDVHAGLVLAGWVAAVVVGGVVFASRRDVK